MRVSIINDGFLIEPETDFETEYIRQFLQKKLTAFVKTGLTMKDIEGIRVIPRKEWKSSPDSPSYDNRARLPRRDDYRSNPPDNQ